jgi:hypothetical protein
MIERLSQREKRTLKIGGVLVAAILVFAFGTKWIDDWRETRNSLAEIRAKLKVIDVDEAKQAGLFSIVPVFEMPQVEEKQKILFRDKLDEQLKRAGIRSEPLQVLPVAKARQAGYKSLRLKCTAKCKFGQVLDLLARLKENPYLVGIEEMRIKCDTKKPPGQRQDVELNLTVSTFVK